MAEADPKSFLEGAAIEAENTERIASFFSDWKSANLPDAIKLIDKIRSSLLSKIPPAERGELDPINRKRSLEDSSSNGSKAPRVGLPEPLQTPLTSFFQEDELDLKTVSIIVLVPNEGNVVGHMIGKGGASVKNVMSQSGANIKIETDEGYQVSNGERRICLQGTVRSISLAQQMLIDLVLEKNVQLGRRFDTVRIIIPDQSAGRIIGKGWCTMHELEAQSAAKFQILGKTQLPSLVSGRVINIVGDPAGLARAFYLISRKVISKVDFDQIWLGGDPTSGKNAVSVPPQGGGGGGAYGGPGAASQELMAGLAALAQQGGGGQAAQMAAGLLGSALVKGQSGTFPGAGMPGDRSSFYAALSQQPQLAPSGDTGETQTMEIPETSVGFVFGRGGNQIRAIRERTGTSINSSKKTPDGSRVLEVRGSPQAVAAAMQLVNVLVQDWARRQGLVGGSGGSDQHPPPPHHALPPPAGFGGLGGGYGY
mmetsp:Transcript_5180/g.7877  ORF Transcript_5180/g.7877 Transcript_5180/m.7877 type:complete len:481 (-) Transcript_5180:348-1790(-)|eukprot:CAMPEP_0113942816 /NCGR_PEP_ID=MMETSP1339-20121228/10015_1 /TAXON_ID=94617 /ORGANISM="Fibrocapsa japonica" /LENGTH=480 /DNA_ID=CAMNT_0000947449 /DNA_START=61 /DNA_END=1503 /DNA_ORIENTATION=- /assembly_acc=CAM_ASM_000762